ncbi:MAG: YgiQ family radical SAM protein [Desulfovibrionaceae bacterium]
MSRHDMDALGWDALDVLLVTGDAYVDHPSFGAPLLGRLLHSRGWRVGIVAQPDWRAPACLAAMGRPRLFVGVTAGALDSMLAHYTAFRKKRSDDAYTPGGQAGARPNRAVTVYANLARQAFPGLPVVLGGIEASLRRASHYDFWTDGLRRSVLLDAKADLLVYGMGERPMLEIAARLDAAARRGAPYAPDLLAGIGGTAQAVRADEVARLMDAAGAGAELVTLPPHEAIEAQPALLMEATLALEAQVHGGTAWAAQEAGGRTVLIAPPAAPLSTGELDALYDLPFTRKAHPAYTAPIPATAMMQGSITSHRGCAGGCSFCALALHQGRRIRSRSRDSIVREAARMAAQPGFDGGISDVGGPSANMWGAFCAADPGACKRASCLTPKPCAQFKVDQKQIIALLRAVRAVPGVRHVRVASGLRLDLALRDQATLRDYVAEFVGGQLKVAPEHSDPATLRRMRKPAYEHFETLCAVFEKESRASGKEQYIVPYLMSGFPGCTDEAMRALADWLRGRGWRPRQVQCFIPLPGTVAAAMYFAGVDADGAPIAVARSDAARLRQHGILVPTRQPGRGNAKPPRKPDQR